MNDGLARDVLANANRNIEEYGFSGVHTFLTDHPDDAEGTCPMSYTVGLADAEMPEIVVTGLLPGQAHGLLVTAANTCLLLGEPFALDTPITGIVPNYSVRFTSVSAQRLHVARSLFILSNVSAVQLVWPDSNGRFPGDPDYYLEPIFQPLLEPEEVHHG